MVELEASQDELDALGCDASTEELLEMSHETNDLRHQLQSKYRPVKKVAKQTKIQELRSQIAETDHQLD